MPAERARARARASTCGGGTRVEKDTRAIESRTLAFGAGLGPTTCEPRPPRPRRDHRASRRRLSCVCVRGLRVCVRARVRDLSFLYALSRSRERGKPALESYPVCVCFCLLGLVDVSGTSGRRSRSSSRSSARAARNSRLCCALSCSCLVGERRHRVRRALRVESREDARWTVAFLGTCGQRELSYVSGEC